MAENKIKNALFTDDDLLEKYHESRKANLKLLEQRREMLLELQRAKDDRETEGNLSEKCKALERKVEELEGKLAEMKPKEGLLDTSSTEQPNTCNCSCSSQLQETITVNHQWNDAYKRSVARVHDAEKRTRRLEAELKLEIEENARLIEMVNTLQNDLKSHSINGYKRINSFEDVCSRDDIEALKLQMLTFQDDFNTEKEEKQKSINESAKLKSQLDDSKKTIQSLSDKVTLYRHQIMKLTQNQDHLYRQIKALADDSGSYRYEPMQRQLSYRHSYPLDIQAASLGQSSAALRFSDPDMFNGGRVVRDAVCDS